MYVQVAALIWTGYA